MTILIIDDEPAITETLEAKFRREGFITFTAESAEDGMRLFKKIKPDIVILDIMLPNRSGHDFCRAVRKENQTPIIFVSARASEEDRIAGLEMGADDYVVKPFNMSELVARVRAILRRATSEAAPDLIERGNLKIDPRTHEAFIDGKLTTFSPKEFALLLFLAKNAGQVFTRETLLDRVWGKDAYVTSRTVDVHIRWLRMRLEKDQNAPERIITIRGIGYKFVG
ncbi:MAG: response regulator transcription factor [Fimbriimonadaceae bacterium]|jgi:DNA-binding response OmpR family regulator|nr:response regulator transcription factor [Fimbriimonadaceae bacterium]MCE2767443.1 response regulator transcription factor [Fimbriimonadaceae bacterium]